MEFEDAFNVIDSAIVSQAGRHLSAPEVTLLKGTWQGMTYEQMADNSQYSLNYLMRDVGPKFWRLLSSALGKEVSKTNIRLLMEQQNGFGASLLDVKSSLPLETPSQGRRLRRMDPKALPRVEVVLNPVWDVMPEVPVFCGRDDELERLSQWSLEEQVQLISISGLSGVGKTALARMFVDDVQESFDTVLWRSIAHGPSLVTLIKNIVEALERPFKAGENPISLLMAELKEHRCLLILDGIEGILESESLAGQYRPGFEDYGQLLRRLSDVSHQSCLVLTGLEIPHDLQLHQSDAIAFRNLELSGLQLADAQALLENAKLDDVEAWPELIRRYAGYPGALTAVANLSHTLFNGKVSAFLDHQTFVFGEVSRQLDQSFNRLSPFEKEVLFFLALQGEPLAFSSIEQGVPISMSGRELFEVLASLKSRSLLITPEMQGQSLFGLSQLVMEYVTGVLIHTIGGQAQEMPETLHPLSRKEDGVEEILDLSAVSIQEPTRLGLWFDQNYPSSWESFSSLLNETDQLAVRLRSTYHLRAADVKKRFKRIFLGDRDSICPLALLVSVSQEAAGKVGIRVQVQSLNQSALLPEKLSLSLLNSHSEALKTITASRNEYDIHLPFFRGDRNEQFTIQLDWKKQKVQESFVI